MNRAPTEKQQAFARLVAEGKNLTEAYRAAYPNNKAKPEVQNVAASRLAKHPKVSELIQALRAQALAKASTEISYGLREALDEADQAFKMAVQNKQSGQMSHAVTVKAKLLGLFAEERKNDRTPLTDLTEDQLDGQIAAASAEAGLVIQKAKEGAVG